LRVIEGAKTGAAHVNEAKQPLSDKPDSRKVKARLAELGLAGREAAALLKMNAATFSKLLNGKFPPRVGFAESLEKALNVPVGSLRS
jgi:hypothetical protein